MKYDPTKHRRRSTRLKNFDYSEPGYYFSTVVTEGRLPLFGNIVDGRTRLSDFGIVTYQCWQHIPKHFPNVYLDDFVVMPNHLHGIVIVERVGARHAVPLQGSTERFGLPTAGTIPTIVRSFKSAVTKEIRSLQKEPGRKIWHGIIMSTLSVLKKNWTASASISSITQHSGNRIEKIPNEQQIRVRDTRKHGKCRGCKPAAT